MVTNLLKQHSTKLPSHLRSHNENNTHKKMYNYNVRKYSKKTGAEWKYPLLIDKNILTIIEYPPEYLDFTKQNHRYAKANVIGNNKKFAKNKSDENVIVIGRSVDSKIHKAELRKQNRTNTEKIIVPIENVEPRIANELTNKSANLRLFFKTKPAAPKERDSSSTTTTTTTSLPLMKDITESNEENEENEKGPFSSFFNKEKETAIEALKQGGVIIKRLRVRNGGIAIAGPGGVATAGSGGTAIVGPGGIALTHPRSLTIAGPGARVYSFPKTTDLETLALNSSSGRNLDNEGVFVGFGPIIYYNS